MNAHSVDKVFQLLWEVEGVEEGEYVAELMKFPGYENIVGWSFTHEIPVPDKIFFETDFSRLEDTDFPNNDVQWPIMSRRMLRALLSVRQFPHREIPVIMIDDTVLEEHDRFDEAGLPRAGVAKYDYVAVQLLEHLDVFDWDRSVYVRVEDFPDEVDSITRLILKTPADGFPPLFRLSVSQVYLFVSSEGRAAMERAGIQGVVYGSLDNFPIG